MRTQNRKKGFQKEIRGKININQNSKMTTKKSSISTQNGKRGNLSKRK